jgi:hypothetical protein
MAYFNEDNVTEQMCIEIAKQAGYQYCGADELREANPDLKGNIRDYATINELICLSNMENINAVLINDGMPQGERLVKLNQIAIQQMQVLEDNEGRKLLK